MKLIEEVYVKADKNTICQTCGIDIPEGTNHLLETYVHQGNILVSHYCLNKKLCASEQSGPFACQVVKE